MNSDKLCTKAVGIYVDVYVDTEKNPISAKDLNDKLIEWAESNNWQVGGIVKPDITGMGEKEGVKVGRY